MSTDMSNTPWIKASKSSGTGGDCVELRRRSGAVEVRDSKAGGTGPTLRLTSVEFST